jgi:hypothetical protein
LLPVDEQHADRTAVQARPFDCFLDLRPDLQALRFLVEFLLRFGLVV